MPDDDLHQAIQAGGAALAALYPISQMRGEHAAEAMLHAALPHLRLLIRSTDEEVRLVKEQLQAAQAAHTQTRQDMERLAQVEQAVKADLHQAIHAATEAAADALMDDPAPWTAPHQMVDAARGAARMVVEAAAPVLLHATRAENELLLERIEAHSIEGIRLENELQATRDRHADLEVQVAELRDLLEQSISGQADCWRCDMPGGYHLVGCTVAAALQTSGPARGHAILQEVQRFQRAIPWILNAHVISCYFCEDDAVTIVGNTDDDFMPACQPCADQVARNLAALDQAAPGEVDHG